MVLSITTIFVKHYLFVYKYSTIPIITLALTLSKTNNQY